MKLPHKQWRVVHTMRCSDDNGIGFINMPSLYHFPNKHAAEQSVQHRQALDLNAFGDNDKMTYEIFPVMRHHIDDHYEWDYRDCRIIANPKGNRFKAIRDNHMIVRRHHIYDVFADIDQMLLNEKHMR